jgi:tetratricopeptide (TPR) repeat protein
MVENPSISVENVRAALDILLYSTVNKSSSALERLFLVNVYLMNPDLPSTPTAHEYALKQILISTIKDNFIRHCQVHNISIPQDDATVDVASSAIAACARQSSPELMGWCWLYYRYVRIDLDIRFVNFCEAAHIDDRTLRRYQQHATKRLTEQLIETETQARFEQRCLYLFTQLPSTTPEPLFGRDETLKALQIFLTTSNRHHIQITGAHGIGKSTIAQELLRQQIKGDCIDQLIWITHPTSVTFIRQYVGEYLRLVDINVGIREYLSLYRVAVVLDDMNDFRGDMEALNSLLKDLSSALVIITSHIYMSLAETYHIALNELRRPAVDEFVQVLMRNRGDFDDYNIIWEQVGGNPLAIRLFSNNITTLRLRGVQVDVMGLFSQSQIEMSNDLKAAWTAFALFPPGEVEVDFILEIWPEKITKSMIGDLLERHLLELRLVSPTRCALTTSARRYIEQQYRINQSIKAIIDQLINHIELYGDDVSDNMLSLIEHILDANWLALDERVWQRLTRAIWLKGLRNGHFALWNQLLEKYIERFSSPETEIIIAYGICLRSVGESVRANEIFQQIIARTGSNGSFNEQGQALLELAITLRLQGQYENALIRLSQIERMPLQYRNHSLIHTTRIERAQIAVDSGEPRLALQLLSDLPETPLVLFLRSEAYFLLGQWDMCYQFAQQALTAFDGNQRMEGRIHTIIGRCYANRDLYDAANYHLSLAVTLLEQEQDIYALARAEINLAALLMQMNFDEEAGLLLKRAEYSLAHLKDQVALEAVRHNLRLLDTKVGR